MMYATDKCPRSRVDEILAAIDTGLQTAGDLAYGNDRNGVCWRCRCVSEIDLCEGCRVELLDETSPPAQMPLNIVIIAIDTEAFVAALARVLADIAKCFVEQILPGPRGCRAGNSRGADVPDTRY